VTALLVSIHYAGMSGTVGLCKAHLVGVYQDALRRLLSGPVRRPVGLL
jgi:hypothetical protein